MMTPAKKEIPASRFTRQTAYELYACLGSDNRRSLWRALAILDTKGLPAIAFLTGLLALDIQGFRRSHRQRAWLLILTIALFVLAHGRFLLGWPVQNEVGLLFFVLSVLTMRSLTVHCVAHSAKQRRIRNLLFLLQESPPVERINVFVDVMRCGDSDASCLAQAILVETLPHLKDRDLLTPDQYQALCQALRGTNSNLILAILAAFEQIGVPRSYRAVRRLVSCPAGLADARRIERAANACLLAMEERAKRHVTAQTSLRATMPTVSSARTLLRPVESSPADLDAEPLTYGGSVEESAATLLPASTGLF